MGRGEPVKWKKIWFITGFKEAGEEIVLINDDYEKVIRDLLYL